MPYDISTSSPECNGYAVVKPSGEVVACHSRRSDAIRHLRALYVNVPDAVEKASSQDLVALHDKFHKMYANPETDDVIEAHHWLIHGLDKAGIRPAYEPDWSSAIASSKWQVSADGVDLEEIGLGNDPLVAGLIDDWENGGQNFIVGSVLTNDGLEYVIKQADVEVDYVEKIAESDTFSPPKGVQSEGKRALQWIKDGHAGDGFTDVGRARAAQLAAGRPVSLRTIRRMHSYFIRHKNDSQGQGYTPQEKGYPSPGRVAWAAWGGDAGRSWAESIVNRANREEEANKSISVIKAVAEKQFTLGPMYIPNKIDAHGEWTDGDELQQAVWDYVKKGDRRIRLQHNKDIVAGEWVEVMAFPYAMEVPMNNPDGTVSKVEYPANTVFLGVQWEDWAWDLVKAGKVRGYSIGGKASRMDAEPELEVQMSDPSVNSVHVDTIMKPTRRKPKQ